MLFAHCLAFEALLGCFYVEKKSVASAKHFLITASVFPSSPVSLHTVEMHKDRQFPCTEIGVCLWSKQCLLSLARLCSHLFPWPFPEAAPQLPNPCFSNRSFETNGLPCAEGCGSGHRLHLCPLPLWERKWSCFIIRSEWGWFTYPSLPVIKTR